MEEYLMLVRNPWLRFIEGSEGGAAGDTQSGDGQPSSAAEQSVDTTDIGEGGKKAIAAERAARKRAEKDAAQLKARLDEIEASKKSELDSIKQEAADAKAASQSAAVEALRYRIAAQHGISIAPGDDGEPSDAELFLTGSDEDAMMAQAKRLAARIVDHKTHMHVPSEGGVSDTSSDASQRTFIRRLTGRD